MKKGDYQKKNGFTIIEVSLVLAIAGLIFLMVFVALPQLQRQQRDSRRRDDILSFLETVKKYQTNNRGALPKIAMGSQSIVTGESMPDTGEEDNWTGFYRDYLGENFIDPDGGRYALNVAKCDKEGRLVATGENCIGTFSYSDTLSNLPNESFPNGHRIYVIMQAECNGSVAVKSSNPRKIAALYRLEGAGVYCANT